MLKREKSKLLPPLKPGHLNGKLFFLYIYPSPTDYSNPLGFGLSRPLCVGAIHDLSIFRPSRRPFWSRHVHRTAPPRPARPPARWIFTPFCSRFVKETSGAPRGGIMSLEGVQNSTKLKLRADLFHHTHEVWGPCSYKNTPLRGRGPRVLESYCGFPIFAQAVFSRFVCVLLTQGISRHFQSVWC